MKSFFGGLLGGIVAVVLMAAGFFFFGTGYFYTNFFQPTMEGILKPIIDPINEKLDNLTNTLHTAGVSNVFDIEKILAGDLNVGDTVGNMTLAYTDKFNSADIPYGIDNALIKFTGETQLTGEYNYVSPDDAGIIRDVVCFKPDADSANLIPIKKGFEETRGGFCFSTETDKLAKEKFGPAGSQGTATIKIDNLSRVFTGTEAYDSADLISVISVTPEKAGSTSKVTR